jgi:GntR family transcriptional regulator/MocR family aminotransferase
MIRPDLRELTLELPRDGRPKYLRIADALREAIRAGRVGSGERIPSVRELAAQLRTNRLTVLAAAEELIGEGWIVSEYRRGYRVASALPSAFLEAPKNKAPSPARRHRFALRPRVRLAPFRPEAPVAYNFQSGLPDLRLFPLDEFRALLRARRDRSSSATAIRADSRRCGRRWRTTCAGCAASRAARSRSRTDRRKRFTSRSGCWSLPATP